ncbi:vespryn [Anolis carolinensis]|uniref:vespryn n=1 Tax=Anolis carolinensis TaxID=28377 RepID=UPI000462C678|nr:PREDICTED: vespryn-like [Anolis carolinensis]|eukprot:XP_008103840.1 PREDICTED: vespryn-like [Anolis carolinensis]
MKVRGVFQTFGGLCCILWLSLCFLAELEGGGKVLASTPADVLFDPNTAHPNLHVSPNKKKVTWLPEPQNVPDNPERFNATYCLLGTPRFTKGKHYWEVEYGGQREWVAGVARESVQRKGFVRMTPKEGIWQMGLWWLRRGEMDSHPPPKHPAKIRISLDYEQGTVTFYLENKVNVQKVSFKGESVRPFFYVGPTVSLGL